MRGPEYVLEKAQNRYRSVWRYALLGADSGVYTVALDPPSTSAITVRAGEVSAWLIRWRQWAAQHPDVTLRTEQERIPISDAERALEQARNLVLIDATEAVR